MKRLAELKRLHDLAAQVAVADHERVADLGADAAVRRPAVERADAGRLPVHVVVVDVFFRLAVERLGRGADAPEELPVVAEGAAQNARELEVRIGD